MSGSGEREREERELIINVNNQQKLINNPNFQVYIHKSLAFPPTDESIKMLKDADTTAKRDGWSFSHFVGFCEVCVTRLPKSRFQNFCEKSSPTARSGVSD